MLNCDSYTETDYYLKTTVHRYLTVDRSIDCDTAQYARYFAVSVIFLLAYGFGLPLGTVLVVMAMKRFYGENSSVVNESFRFMMAGYHSRAWYWEVTMLVKKMGLVVIISFVTDLKLQTYLGMWFLTGFLVLHRYVQPYVVDVCNRLEAFSLVMIITTLNLGLLYEWDTSNNEGGTDWYFTLLTAAIMFLITVAIVVFLYAIFDAIKRKTFETFDVSGDGKLTWEEMKIVIAVKTNGRFKRFPIPQPIQDIADKILQLIDADEAPPQVVPEVPQPSEGANPEDPPRNEGRLNVTTIQDQGGMVTPSGIVSDRTNYSDHDHDVDDVEEDASQVDT
jgi:hypothetical protein